MQQPPMNQMPMQNGMNNNLLSSLGPEFLKKVSKNLVDTVSMQAQEAIQMGKPWGSVLEDLLKMAPPGMSAAQDAGKSAGMAMMGGGSPPPGGPNGNGGGGKPPQGPTGIQDNQDSSIPQAGGANNYNQALLGNNNPQPTPQSVEDLNQLALSQIPTAQDTANRFLSPQAPQQGGQGLFSPNRINEQGQFQQGGLFGTLFGLNSDQAARLMTAGQNMNTNQAQESAVKAAITPASASEKLTARNTQYSNIVGQENKISEDYTKQVLEPFNLAKNSFDKVSAYYALPSNGVNDLGMAYEFIKAKYPDSVKEGELKNLNDTIPWLKRLGIKARLDGTKFDKATKTQILRAVTTDYNIAGKRASSGKERYSKKVESYGGNPKRALVDFNSNNNDALIVEAKKRGLI